MSGSSIIRDPGFFFVKLRPYKSSKYSAFISKHNSDRRSLLLRFEGSRSTFNQPPLLALEFLFAKHALVAERFKFSQLVRHANM